MEDNCIFCKIIKGEIPSNKVYEDEYVLAFKDLHPVTPVHVLVIPKTHIQDLEHITDENAIYVQKCQQAFQKVSKETGVSESGYRVICNCGEDGGQEVKHLHYHLLGGQKLETKIVHE